MSETVVGDIPLELGGVVIPHIEDGLHISSFIRSSWKTSALIKLSEHKCVETPVHSGSQSASAASNTTARNWPITDSRTRPSQALSQSEGLKEIKHNQHSEILLI